jgi:hypothetical protein
MHKRLAQSISGKFTNSFRSDSGEAFVTSGTMSSGAFYGQLDDGSLLSVSIVPALAGEVLSSGGSPDNGILSFPNQIQHLHIAQGNENLFVGDVFSFEDWTFNATDGSVTDNCETGPWGLTGPKAACVQLTSGSEQFLVAMDGSQPVGANGIEYISSIYLKFFPGSTHTYFGSSAGERVKLDPAVLGYDWIRVQRHVTGDGSTPLNMDFQWDQGPTPLRMLLCAPQLEIGLVATPFIAGARSPAYLEISSGSIKDTRLFSFFTNVAVANVLSSFAIPIFTVQETSGKTTQYQGDFSVVNTPRVNPVRSIVLERTPDLNAIRLRIPDESGFEHVISHNTTWSSGEVHNAGFTVSTSAVNLYLDGVPVGSITSAQIAHITDYRIFLGFRGI